MGTIEPLRGDVNRTLACAPTQGAKAANLFPAGLVYHSVMSNLKLAFRMLVKTPFVTIVAILSLALGIGANTAIFSVFDQLLRRPLPVEDPERLVNLLAPGPKPGSTSCNSAGPCEAVFSYPMFRDLEQGQSPFTALAAHRLFGANLAANGQTFTGDGVAVSGSYFATLGIQPALGRFIGPTTIASKGKDASRC